jgi:3-hydroxyisobutyrate dehydrogenase
MTSSGPVALLGAGGTRLRLAAKDAALADEAAARRDLDLPLVAAVRERLEEGARGHGDEDMSATYLTSAPG